MFVKERATSRAGNAAFEGSTAKLEYDMQLEGVETETDAFDYLVANAPATFTTVTGTSYKYASVSVTPSDVGNGILVGEVTYTQVKPLQFTFQTGGGSEKIDYSKATVHQYTAAGKDGASAAPDFNQAINVTRTSIEGITIKASAFSFKLTKSWGKGTPFNSSGLFAGRTAHDGEAAGYRYLSTNGTGSGAGAFTPIEYVHGVGAGVWAAATDVTGEISGKYIQDIKRMTPSKNDDTVVLQVDGVWMVFYAGELLFEGIDGVKSTDNRYELTYVFTESKNIAVADTDSHQVIGDLTVDEKEGHDLAWIYSEEATDQNVPVRTPKAVYIEQVYDYADFDLLRLNE